MINLPKITSSDIENLREKIAEYKSLDMHSASEQEIFRHVVQICSRYVLSNVSISNRKLFRIRRASHLGEYLENEDDVWWPPSPQDGRVNRAGKPILYTSDSLETAINECGIAVGDAVNLIQYSVKQGESLIFADLTRDFDELKLKDNLQCRYFKLVQRFILSEITKDIFWVAKKNYLATQVMSETFLDVPHGNGYMYPSVARLHQGTNYAIKIEIAKSKIKFDCCCHMIYHGRENGGAVIYLHGKSSRVVDGRLVRDF